MQSLQVFKGFFCYGVRLGTKSIITFRIVWFFCVKQQKVPATDEITGWHETQITPKQTILATDFQWIFKERFSFKFQDNLKIQNKYYVLKCESYTPQNW